MSLQVDKIAVNLPTTWQQLNAFRHVGEVKTTCWSSKQQKWEERGPGDFERSEHSCRCQTAPVQVWEFHELLLIYWDFHTQQPLLHLPRCLDETTWAVRRSFSFLTSSQEEVESFHVTPAQLRLSNVDGQYTYFFLVGGGVVGGLYL